MNDRELLENAAKAAGYELGNHYPNQGGVWCKTLDRVWSPLNVDGDAFRLAVILGLMVDIYTKHSIYSPATESMLVMNVTDVYLPNRNSESAASEQHLTDAMKATRRAIVRAAASMADL